ncbi:hypothetical protein DV872_12965 [Oceanispirochaeta sp. M1]|nr:hypothetical protein DV872_12965 [Oceanispirochaeta sp. M1]
MLEVQNDSYIDPFETDWFNEVKESFSSGAYLKTDRENKGRTQNELGSDIGSFSRQYFSRDRQDCFPLRVIFIFMLKN